MNYQYASCPRCTSSPDFKPDTDAVFYDPNAIESIIQRYKGTPIDQLAGVDVKNINGKMTLQVLTEMNYDGGNMKLRRDFVIIAGKEGFFDRHIHELKEDVKDFIDSDVQITADQAIDPGLLSNISQQASCISSNLKKFQDEAM
ncbi:hypothetical protein [Sulfuracidifex tepidarius]|uniref:Uncharacterized protein n=1 Tax=Sulfuracidifex tepidarius TaxID=1294262 RepID=A0A510DSP2_9CREN|nr:hypothetical protein [Sulfuracidifex tepidarius]BBG23226.1 hypothetical protein IC006_0510 [Sulfuracidifex tepidarius]BBG25975.1 hypothetical protein IC007_0480 [Sulfuracidifex tepidarius]